MALFSMALAQVGMYPYGGYSLFKLQDEHCFCSVRPIAQKKPESFLLGYIDKQPEQNGSRELEKLEPFVSTAKNDDLNKNKMKFMIMVVLPTDKPDFSDVT